MTDTRVIWQNDSAFNAWLLTKNYAAMDGPKGILKHKFAGDGIVIYMWEAWRAGRQIEGDR